LVVAIATAEAPQHALPAGTAVVFVADARLDSASPNGATIVVHLRDPLLLDGVTLAPAGTKARLQSATSLDNGKRELHVGIDRFTINGGFLPVKLVGPLPSAIDTGTTLETRTMAIVEHVGDRYSIRIPFPFPLSADRPAAYYTPTPARTAPPHSLSPRRGGSPSPTPAPSPAVSAAIETSPAPSATKIP
jgi:hypothetical protein